MIKMSLMKHAEFPIARLKIGTCNLALLLLFSLLISKAFIVDVQAQENTGVTGVVTDQDGNPISGANVTLLDFNRQFIVKTAKTDSSGRFYLSVNREGSYLIYVAYDDKKTPGIDYVPERWRTWISKNSVSSHQFILKRGASIHIDGDARHVETNKVAVKYQFIVLEPKNEEKDQWTGPVREYGGTSYIVRFLGFDERLIIIPADTEVKIQVTASFPAGLSQKFILTGKTGHFKLPQGESLHIDIREYSILSNIEYVKGILASCFTLLDNCQTAGFLVETERRDLSNAYEAIEESAFLLKKGLFDQSFAKVRSSYILATRAENMLRGLLESSSQALFPLLLLLLFVAFASAHLIMEKSIYLEITSGNRGFSISATSIVEAALFFLLFTIFYFVFPASRLVSQTVYVSLALTIFLVGKIIIYVFSRLAREKRSEDRPIQLKSAVAIAFSMGIRNLRRRKMRTLLNLISVMVLIFGFITLTSISPGYGLVKRSIRSVLPVDALLIKDMPFDGYIGSFIPLPDSFIDWLESQENVTLVSPKAVNNPVSFENPLGYLYSTSGERISILGVIGIIPSREARFIGLDRVTQGFLEDDDSKGILVSSSLRERLKVNVGDKLYGFGQEFIIRGFFDGESLSKIIDIDDQAYLPYYHLPSPPYIAPCPADNVIILTYEKALALPKVYTSRVVVQLSKDENYESLAQLIVLTYAYKVFISHPGSAAMYSLSEYFEERGTELVFPLMALVMLNIGLSMFATVVERDDEIFTLSSVGLNPTHIAALFIAEASIIGFIGGGLGYLLGISGYHFASIAGIQVREKVSAEWGIISILFSVLTAIVASLIPASRSSTVITPSLLRKWSVKKVDRPREVNEPWIFDLPIRLIAKEIEPFTSFIVRRLQKDESEYVRRVGGVKLVEEPPEKGALKKISFDYYLVEKAGRTRSDIIIQEGEEGYQLKLIVRIVESSSAYHKVLVQTTVAYVRKIILEWSAATCEVLATFDPYLSRFYNLVNAYSPTTLYIISAEPDVQDKIDEFRESLISRGIRPPKFAVSHVDIGNLERTTEIIKDLVSRADIVCISGEDAFLCSALAIEAAKQNKIICHVIDDRTAEERMKNPFKDLKVTRLS